MTSQLRCAISNTVPTHPVVGIPTGLVYERSIVEKAIVDEGKCPVTGVPLKKQDLVSLKLDNLAQVNPPRSLDGSSIPSLLASFQNEWDAMALETFKLRQLLDKTRKELAQALYQHDAACRVIARLAKERDEARAALGTIAIPPTTTAPAAASSPAQQPAGNGSATAKGASNETGKVVPLKPEEVKRIEEVTAQLQSTRSSKRKTMSGAAETLSWKSEELLKVSGSSCCIDLDDEAGIVAVGTKEGKVSMYNRANGKLERESQFDLCRISRVRVGRSKSVLAACSDSKLRIVSEEGKIVAVGLKNAATDCCEHPTKDFALVSDQSGAWSLVRMETGEIASSGASSSPAFCIDSHPDGKLFAYAGNGDGSIEIWDVTGGKLQTLKASAPDSAKLGPVSILDFGENGVSLVSVHANTGAVKVWDMRKPENPVHSFTSASSKYCSAAFDPSGQTLVVGAQDGSFQVRNVLRTGAWPVALESPATQAGLISVAPGRGSLLTLSSNGVVNEWK